MDFINDKSVKNDNNEDNENNKIINICNISEYQEYNNKINKLEKYIKELESKLKEKDIIFKKEKEKNHILNKRIKELENKLNKNYEMKNNLELENEIKLFRKYCNFKENEKLISINFISVEQDINYSIISKNTVKFNICEGKLYEKYPNYAESENFFLANGNIIKKYKSLEENNIKNNDIITLQIANSD